jgi:hypothetical protein
VTTKTPDQVRRAYKVLDHIAKHPGDWNQGDWRCDSGMCFAGWAAQLAGGKWVMAADAIGQPELLHANKSDDPEDIRHTARRGFDEPLLAGEFVSARARAQRLLGLTDYEAGFLFAGTNTMPTLRRLVRKYYGPRPE